MFRRSTPHQCSLVHIYTCSCITTIHVNLLSPSARGTRQHNQHMRTCVERHRARVLKRPQGKWALHYSYRHLLRSTRVLNNTEVKGHYSTICRHACFGVPRLINNLQTCMFRRSTPPKPPLNLEIKLNYSKPPPPLKLL